MDRDAVMAWVDEYERAWRGGDVQAIARLFSDEARYRVSPYEDSKIGQHWSQVAVGAAAVSHAQHQNDEFGVPNRVDHPVVANADAPQVGLADKWSGTIRSWGGGQRVDCPDDPSSR